MTATYDLIYLSGEQKFAAIDVTSEASFSVSGQIFSLKRCSDQTLILDGVAADTEVITDGHKIKYNLDTSGLAAGSYLGVFEFSRDGIETRKKTIHIKISDLSC